MNLELGSTRVQQEASSSFDDQQAYSKISLNVKRRISPPSEGAIEHRYSPTASAYKMCTSHLERHSDSLIESLKRNIRIGVLRPAESKLPSSSAAASRNPVLVRAMEELQQSLVEGNHRRMIEAWNSLGLVHLHTELDPREAIRCHENALQLLQSSSALMGGNERIEKQFDQYFLLELATTFHDLGLCYERLNDTKQALELYQRAKEVLARQSGHMEAYPRMSALERVIDRLLGCS